MAFKQAVRSKHLAVNRPYHLGVCRNPCLPQCHCRRQRRAMSIFSRPASSRNQAHCGFSGRKRKGLLKQPFEKNPRYALPRHDPKKRKTAPRRTGEPVDGTKAENPMSSIHVRIREKPVSGMLRLRGDAHCPHEPNLNVSRTRPKRQTVWSSDPWQRAWTP